MKYIWLIISVSVLSCSPNFNSNKVNPNGDLDIKSEARSICFLGDTGTARKTQYLVSKAMFEDGCDELRILGDVIYGRGLKSKDDPQFFEKFYNPYSNFIKSGRKISFVMGNHDHQGRVSSWFEILKDYPTVNMPNLYYSEVYQDVCFISLDTELTTNRAQLKWIESAYKDLKKKNCKISIAVSHRPLKSIGWHGNSGNPHKKFLEDSVVGKFDMLFSGHDHNLSYEGELKGTHMFVSGAGAKLRSLGKKAKPHLYGISSLGYIKVIINRDDQGVSAKYEFKLVSSTGAFKTGYSGAIQGQGVR